MQTSLVARRTQFSSCDECRRLRVRCDALSRRNNTRNPSAPCSRCMKRRHQCTFEWMNNVKRASARKCMGVGSPGSPASPTGSRASSSRGITDPRGDPTPSETATQTQTPPLRSVSGGEPGVPLGSSSSLLGSNSQTTDKSPLDDLNPDERHWLQVIYLSGFENVFGSWMSTHGCPFLSESSSRVDDHISISTVCERLDRWMKEMSRADPAVGYLNNHVREPDKEDRLADQSLHSTMASFSARWLPVVSRNPHLDEWHQSVVHSLWRHARRDMLRVINRPSYRSMLALFLFALTPVPAGVSEEEEADGLSGQACVHAAFQQIQTLRARQRSLQFNGTKVSQLTKPKAGIPAIPNTIGATDFIAAENVAYWAALTFDTSASLTLNCRPLLSSGLMGFENELPWRLVRAGATILHKEMEGWRLIHGAYEINDKRANQIIASATAWKLLAWKLTAVFKEALRDGHDELEISRAFSLVLDAMYEFNNTYRGPLEACQRRLPFLEQETKFRWYSLMLHYHLSILLLVNVLETTDRFDLLADVEKACAAPADIVLNILLFGLHNTMTLAIKIEYTPPNPVTVTETSVTVPLIALDPYQHHIVACVQLVQSAVDRDLENGKIGKSAHQNVRSVLKNILSHLPESSKSVKAARDSFCFPELNLTGPDLYSAPLLIQN